MPNAAGMTDNAPRSSNLRLYFARCAAGTAETKPIVAPATSERSIIMIVPVASVLGFITRHFALRDELDISSSAPSEVTTYRRNFR
jgi:hypothetical protein